jgi:sulfatase maturation enzyme AslB (radical SAM superfamily)
MWGHASVTSSKNPFLCAYDAQSKFLAFSSLGRRLRSSWNSSDCHIRPHLCHSLRSNALSSGSGVLRIDAAASLLIQPALWSCLSLSVFVFEIFGKELCRILWKSSSSLLHRLSQVRYNYHFWVRNDNHSDRIASITMLKWIQDVLYSPGPRIPVACADDADHLSLAVPISVNYFPHRYPVHSTNYQLWKVAHPIDHRKCNYSCEFCFHTTKNLFILPIDEARRGLHLLADAGMKKLNISGGEPFLKPDFIGEVFRFCKEELHLESCSVVNNGSKVTEKWLDAYGKYLDIMAISCDSFDVETSIQLGRAEKGRGTHVGRVFQVAQWCRDRCIKVKINTVVTKSVALRFLRDHRTSYYDYEG